MTAHELVLSCGPAILAIALQYWPIPSDRALKVQAEDLRKTEGLPPVAAEAIEHSLKGAVAVNSITITVVSFISGSAALFNSAQVGTIYLYVLMGLVVLIGIYLWNLLDSRSYFDISAGKIPFFPSFNKRVFIDLTPVRMINVSIYTINGLLISCSVLLYTGLLN